MTTWWPASATPPNSTLRELVAKALFNKGVTLGQLGRREEEIVVYDDVVARFDMVEEPMGQRDCRKYPKATTSRRSPYPGQNCEIEERCQAAPTPLTARLIMTTFKSLG